MMMMMMTCKLVYAIFVIHTQVGIATRGFLSARLCIRNTTMVATTVVPHIQTRNKKYAATNI